MSDWPQALRRYLIASAVLHLAWEVIQLPLYSIWSTGTLAQKAFAVLHCTLGDAMIAGLALLIALAATAPNDWPHSGLRPTWLTIVVLAVAYTIYSEWLNTTVRASWSYSKSMPTLPLTGTGLSPLLQWIVIPSAALWWAAGRRWPHRKRSTIP
jgi:hypothetical protein